MIPETTPWSVRPIVNPAGQRTGVQILNVTGELVAQVLGASDEVLAMAVTLVSTVNARPYNLELWPDALLDQDMVDREWVAEYRAAQRSEAQS